jgi:hypothetical protein
MVVYSTSGGHVTAVLASALTSIDIFIVVSSHSSRTPPVGVGYMWGGPKVVCADVSTMLAALVSAAVVRRVSSYPSGSEARS